MEHCKLQIGCIVILLYITFIYLRERRNYKLQSKKSLFEGLLLLGIVSILLDGITAYTVNHLDVVDPLLNRTAHALFLISLNAVIFVLCLYMLVVTGAYPKKKLGRTLIFLPFIANIVLVFMNIGSLRYIEGRVTNYSMGASVYTCFIMAAVYILMVW